MSDPVVGGNLLRDSGLLFDSNRKVFHPFGLSLTFDPSDDTWDVVEHKENPEYMVFQREDMFRGQNKLKEFIKKEGQAAMDRRLKMLGYIVQKPYE